MSLPVIESGATLGVLGEGNWAPCSPPQPGAWDTRLRCGIPMPTRLPIDWRITRCWSHFQTWRPATISCSVFAPSHMSGRMCRASSVNSWSARSRFGRRVSLAVIQDRIEQKTFLQSHGLTVPAFQHLVTGGARPTNCPPIPLICKTSTAGYDGKGQWKIDRAEDCAAVQLDLIRAMRPGLRWILEEYLSFGREVSILVVRGADGAMRTYPVVENIHEDGILRQSTVPADVPTTIAEQAAAMARRAVKALDGVGVFCVELFVMRDGRLLINEVAPRPHNSGHYSLDACTVSQFEQQVRALCGQPLRGSAVAQCRRHAQPNRR